MFCCSGSLQQERRLLRLKFSSKFDTLWLSLSIVHCMNSIYMYGIVCVYNFVLKHYRIRNIFVVVYLMLQNLIEQEDSQAISSCTYIYYVDTADQTLSWNEPMTLKPR